MTVDEALVELGIKTPYEKYLAEKFRLTESIIYYRQLLNTISRRKELNERLWAGGK